MHQSLQRLAVLPTQTRVWVGHEYTLSNLNFAAAVEPDNKAIQETIKRAQHCQNQGLPTIPSSIELELKINPFLRARNAMEFAERRAWKDRF